MDGITVLAPGVCDTVQDRGRFGLLAQGFSPSGAMDQRSAYIANAIVGNPAFCAVLEYAYLGPTLRFNQDAALCFAGAPFTPTLGRAALEPYRIHRVKAGDVIKLGRTQAGVYGYMAVAGGIATQPLLGSRSTSLRYGLGNRLQAGDTLPLEAVRDHSGSGLPSHDAYFRWNSPSPVLWIRVIPSSTPWNDLFTHTYTVLEMSDRMGLRLRCEGVGTPPPSADLPSEALAWGTIQIPASANPLIAMADRQTTGGYFKAGTVAAIDLPRLAQCRPGSSLRFEAITVERAQAMLRRDARYLIELGGRLRSC